jgi:hypothetical protein
MEELEENQKDFQFYNSNGEKYRMREGDRFCYEKNRKNMKKVCEAENLTLGGNK